MKGTIGIEYIGGKNWDQLNSWYQFERKLGIREPGAPPKFGPFVMRVTKGPSLESVKHKRDYSRANSAGTRGVYLWYVLDEGELYLVHEKTSWRSSEDYYVRVTPDGDVKRLSDAEADEWLRNLQE